MRILELAILVLNLFTLLMLYFPLHNSIGWIEFLPPSIICLTIVHLISERYRWQMLPSYSLTALLFLLTLPNLLDINNNPLVEGTLAIIVGGFMLLWWSVSAVLPIVLPVIRLPIPPGAYEIGSVSFHWIDMTRNEFYSSNPNDNRELMVQIWYPAKPTAASKIIPLMDNFDVALPALAKFLQIPAFILDHLRLTTTHTYGNAPIQDDRSPYPVVIYSHGGQSYRTASFSQMEALASSGYIVISIDHPYAAAFTVFPDGRVISSDLSLLPPVGRNEPGDASKREQWQAPIVADQRFVIDRLELLNAGKLDARFAGKLDLERIGLTGVSLGGGAATWTCHLDSRLLAGLAQDGWYEAMPEKLVSTALKQPFMFMQSDTKSWRGDNLSRLDTLYRGVNAPAFHLKLADVLHNDFGDYPLLSPLSALLPERGKLKGKRTLHIVNTYTLAFFDRYLKNQPSSLLNGSSIDYPEVDFKSHQHE
jgi:predicted dienelactone hydrolase